MMINKNNRTNPVKNIVKNTFLLGLVFILFLSITLIIYSKSIYNERVKLFNYIIETHQDNLLTGYHRQFIDGVNIISNNVFKNTIVCWGNLEECDKSKFGSSFGYIPYSYDLKNGDTVIVSIKTEISVIYIYVLVIILIISIIIITCILYINYKKQQQAINSYQSYFSKKVIEIVDNPSQELMQELPLEVRPLVLAFLQNIENYKQVEKKVAIANITQTIAHDIRNPLGMFEYVMKVETLEELFLLKPKLMYSYLKVQAMIENIRMGSVELIVKQGIVKLNFASLISEIKPFALSKGVNFTYIPYDKELRVSLDLSLMERAIINLLRNAIECGAKNVSFTEEVQKHTLILKVSNDGGEIPAEILPKLFTRGVTHGKQGGTGLGLSFVKTVIEGHGGQVVYERINHLTYFTVTLPKTVVVNQEIDNAKPAISSFAENTVTEAHLMQKHKKEFLLIVLQDTEKAKIIATGVGIDSSIIVSFEEHDLKHATLVYSDNSDLISETLCLGISSILAQLKEEPSIAIKKLKRKLFPPI